MEILSAYGVPATIVSAINIFKSKMLRSYHHGRTDFFEIMAGVLQGDTLAPFLFIVAHDYALRIATKDEDSVGFTSRKARSRH